MFSKFLKLFTLTFKQLNFKNNGKKKENDQFEFLDYKFY